MKYFEVTDPYYALIKAETIEEAMKIYVDDVCSDDDGDLIDNIKEVDRDCALIIFSQAKDEDGVLSSAKKIIERFNDSKKHLLAMDGSLI